MHPQLAGLGPGKNLRQQAFSTLQNTAKAIVVAIKAHPHPTKDQLETMEHQILGMAKGVKLYCEDTPGTTDIQSSYVNAKTAIEILRKADAKKLTDLITREVPRILKEMQHIEQAQYVAPPAPPAPPPARPAAGPPTAAHAPAPTAAHAPAATAAHAPAPPRPASGPAGTK
jgi:hypothetical protein